MPATWSFNRSYPSDVDMEVTQIEQFDNEEIKLGNSLVREVIQNSMDAHDKGAEPVEIHFSIRNLTELGTLKVKLLREMLKPIEDHLDVCGKSIPIDSSARLLCIEDFNTTGLTGKIDQKDGENFSNFWRVMGTSSKKGDAGGRRGLGKLVFSASSKIRTVFGVTRRKGDNDLLAMGQVILKTHFIDKLKYKPHGFWHDDIWEDQDDFQLPTTDETELENLQYISGFKRKRESGFSILIPYIRDNITERGLIDNVLENYYFSILSNQLVVKVNKTIINADTFERIYKKSKHTKATIPLDFVSSVSKLLKENKEVIRVNTVDLKNFPKNFLSNRDLASMRERYKNRELIHVVVPIMLREKTEEGSIEYKGEYNLFLRSLRKNDSAFKFFARGPLTLIGERRFFNGSCQAGFIAETGNYAASFLGDAENPAHTHWDANAELLRERWHIGRPSPLKVMRNSLQELFNLVAKQEESKENDLLSKFFALSRKKSNQGPDGPVDESHIEVRPDPPASDQQVGFTIEWNEEGFTLKPDAQLDFEHISKKVRLEMAFDSIGGDALGKYDRLDFDLNDPSTIEYSCTGGKAHTIDSNVLDANVINSDFSITVTLKDFKRDLFVKTSKIDE